MKMEREREREKKKVFQDAKEEGYDVEFMTLEANSQLTKKIH
jgi:hypothetical protein